MDFRNLGYLIGSFTNPEAVKKLMDAEANTYVSSDEEFDEFSRQMIAENRKKDEENKPKRKRQRKKILAEAALVEKAVEKASRQRRR